MILVLNKNSYSSNNNHHHHHHPGSFTRILDGYNAFQCLGGTGSRLELWLRPFQTHDSQTKYQHRMLNTSLFGILLTHHGKTHKNKKKKTTCHVRLKCCACGSYAPFLIGWQHPNLPISLDGQQKMHQPIALLESPHFFRTFACLYVHPQDSIRTIINKLYP